MRAFRIPPVFVPTWMFWATLLMALTLADMCRAQTPSWTAVPTPLANCQDVGRWGLGPTGVSTSGTSWVKVYDYDYVLRNYTGVTDVDLTVDITFSALRENSGFAVYEYRITLDSGTYSDQSIDFQNRLGTDDRDSKAISYLFQNVPENDTYEIALWHRRASGVSGASGDSTTHSSNMIIRPLILRDAAGGEMVAGSVTQGVIDECTNDNLWEDVITDTITPPVAGARAEIKAHWVTRGTANHLRPGEYRLLIDGQEYSDQEFGESKLLYVEGGGHRKLGSIFTLTPAMATADVAYTVKLQHRIPSPETETIKTDLAYLTHVVLETSGGLNIPAQVVAANPIPTPTGTIPIGSDLEIDDLETTVAQPPASNPGFLMAYFTGTNVGDASDTHFLRWWINDGTAATQVSELGRRRDDSSAADTYGNLSSGVASYVTGASTTRGVTYQYDDEATVLQEAELLLVSGCEEIATPTPTNTPPPTSTPTPTPTATPTSTPTPTPTDTPAPTSTPAPALAGGGFFMLE